MHKKVTDDLNRFSFNTVVSTLMICLNDLIQLRCNKQKIISKFIILLSPYAPYISEEIWELLGNKQSVHHQKWPYFDEKFLKKDSFNYPISFNGRMRFNIDIKTDLDQDEIKKKILSHPKTISYLDNKPLKKVIIVPNKIINIVF